MKWAVPIGSAALLLTGCQTLNQKPTYMAGAWGGPHVGILFQGGLSDVQLDCATGTIDDPLPAEGKFAAPGTYRVPTRGRANISQFFKSQKAQYAGEIVKDSMTISIALEDGTAIGPFTLTRGAPPELTRCE